jgi:hypothetical protein
VVNGHHGRKLGASLAFPTLWLAEPASAEVFPPPPRFEPLVPRILGTHTAWKLISRSPRDDEEKHLIDIYLLARDFVKYMGAIHSPIRSGRHLPISPDAGPHRQ